MERLIRSARRYYTEMQRISWLSGPAPEGPLSSRLGGFAHHTSRGWRVLATGFAFVEAGILPLLLAVAVPGLRMLPGGRERAELRVQKAIHWLTRFYLAGVGLLGAFRVRCSDPERLRRPGILVVANHPTLLDAWALMSQMPQADRTKYADVVIENNGTPEELEERVRNLWNERVLTRKESKH